MSFDKIEKWSFRYALLKIIVGFLHNYIWYRKIEYMNINNIPENEAVILAPNHQNALMDALAILFSVKGQPVFLARSDIFANPLTARFLKFIKILPIYRIRDGVESLGKNDEVFNKTLEILNRKQKLVILPEGNHAGMRRLRALKKGVSRIAFKAEEDNNFNLGVKIVPIGIDYSHYQNFRTRLLINFGKPIHVSDYVEAYKENPQKGMNLLRMRLKEEISPLMMDIQSQDNYDQFYALSNMMTANNKQKLLQKLLSRKEIVKKLEYAEQNEPEIIEKIKKPYEEYNTLLKKYRLRHWVMKRNKLSLTGIFFKYLAYLITFPLFLFGLLTNYIPYKIPELATKNVKDAQFHSSFKFVIGIVSFLIFYTVQVILFFTFVETMWIRLAFVIMLPLSGLFTLHYFIGLKKLTAMFRFIKLKSSRHKDYDKLVEARSDIDKIIDQINYRHD